MLPGAISRLTPGAEGAGSHRTIRWAEPSNVFSRAKAELASFTGWLGLLVILALAISTAKVTIRLQVQDLQFRISASRALHAKLLGERDVLAQRVAELSHTKRIEDAALLKLGMIHPAPGQEIVLP